MVFSSITFIFVFLSVTLLAYYILPRKCQNMVLLLASLTFYYFGEQRLVVLMIFSSLTDYFCSLGIGRFGKRKWARRLFLGISLAINLGLLGYFKYADLFISSFNALTGAAVPLLKIALPIGISFYTFQTMSYTIDVYRGRFEPERNLIDFAAYVTLFPQLVAGPIVRYETVAAELKERTMNLERFSQGVCRLCVGLGKKVIIANSLAGLTKLYGDAEEQSWLLAVACAVAIPLQIYFDFSGYSDMAIGLGHMFGFTFPENFDYPMSSRSATEFWRRWHMTLGTWFRDYIYFPMGGNRCCPARHIFNLLVVWAVTGMWHGASYNFILWGVYYGVLIVLEKYVWGKWLARKGVFWQIISRAYFAVVTIVGFTIFDCTTLSDIPRRLGQLVGVGVSGFATVSDKFYVAGYAVTLIVALVLSLPVLRRLWERLSARLVGRVGQGSTLCVAQDCLRYAGCLGLLVVSTAFLIDGSYNPFLYFRF